MRSTAAGSRRDGSGPIGDREPGTFCGRARGGRQPVRVEAWRVEAVRELAQRFERVLERRVGGRQPRAEPTQAGAVDPRLREPEREAQRDEALLRAVVQVAFQAPALLIGRLDDAPARLPQLLDASEHCGLEPLGVQAQAAGRDRLGQQVLVERQVRGVHECGHRHALVLDHGGVATRAGGGQLGAAAAGVDPADAGHRIGQRQRRVADDRSERARHGVAARGRDRGRGGRDGAAGAAQQQRPSARAERQCRKRRGGREMRAADSVRGQASAQAQRELGRGRRGERGGGCRDRDQPPARRRRGTHDAHQQGEYGGGARGERQPGAEPRERLGEIRA